MTIDIDCGCGKSIEHDEDINLYNEDYSPIETTCSCCGAEYRLCVHLEFVKDGDPSKKWPEDDPEYDDDKTCEMGE